MMGHTVTADCVLLVLDYIENLQITFKNKVKKKKKTHFNAITFPKAFQDPYIIT